MRHLASSKFWTAYRALPPAIRDLADKNFALLKADPHHPSPHLKKVGGLFSARIGLGYRALAVPVEDGLLWFWIGSHADYDAMLR
ncbi:type II toxin-antitoxin system RelE family toxin [Rhodopseudomonas palustris]|uniref:Type II toxin-antitoxin system RelE/ParE family toxin n=1 Tax=Rhodopseudomonas palustris TaxID=1076 RepID=A0A418UXX1_RHOPL|nr:hypothetical protein [Rhodopseudomonas palustris]RJF66788.1 hypothetical protein D4Q52_23770 [Rhodopseudomonas palustris]